MIVFSMGVYAWVSLLLLLGRHGYVSSQYAYRYMSSIDYTANAINSGHPTDINYRDNDILVIDNNLYAIQLYVQVSASMVSLGQLASSPLDVLSLMPVYSLQIPLTDYYILSSVQPNTVIRIQTLGTQGIVTTEGGLNNFGMWTSDVYMFDLLATGGMMIIAPSATDTMHVWDCTTMSIYTAMVIPSQMYGVSIARPTIGLLYDTMVLYVFDPSDLMNFNPMRALTSDLQLSPCMKMYVSRTLDYIFIPEVTAITIVKLSDLSIVFRQWNQIVSSDFQGDCDEKTCKLFFQGSDFPKVLSIAGIGDIDQPGWIMASQPWPAGSSVGASRFMTSNNLLLVGDNTHQTVHVFQLENCHSECATCSGPLRTNCLTCPINLVLAQGSCCDATCSTCSGPNSSDCTSCSANQYLAQFQINQPGQCITLGPSGLQSNLRFDNITNSKLQDNLCSSSYRYLHCYEVNFSPFIPWSIFERVTRSSSYFFSVFVPNINTAGSATGTSSIQAQISLVLVNQTTSMTIISVVELSAPISTPNSILTICLDSDLSYPDNTPPVVVGASCQNITIYSQISSKELEDAQRLGRTVSSITAFGVTNPTANQGLTLFASMDLTGTLVRINQLLKLVSRLAYFNLPLGPKLDLFLRRSEEGSGVPKTSIALEMLNSVGRRGRLSRLLSASHLLSPSEMDLFVCKSILYLVSIITSYCLPILLMTDKPRPSWLVKLVFYYPRIHLCLFNFCLVDVSFVCVRILSHGTRAGHQIWAAIVLIAMWIDLCRMMGMLLDSRYWHPNTTVPITISLPDAQSISPSTSVPFSRLTLAKPTTLTLSSNQYLSRRVEYRQTYDRIVDLSMRSGICDAPIRIDKRVYLSSRCRLILVIPSLRIAVYQCMMIVSQSSALPCCYLIMLIELCLAVYTLSWRGVYAHALYFYQSMGDHMLTLGIMICMSIAQSGDMVVQTVSIWMIISHCIVQHVLTLSIIIYTVYQWISTRRGDMPRHRMHGYIVYAHALDNTVDISRQCMPAPNIINYQQGNIDRRMKGSPNRIHAHRSTPRSLFPLGQQMNSNRVLIDRNRRGQTSARNTMDKSNPLPSPDH